MHQLGDFLVRGAVFDGIRQPVLRPAQTFQRIRKVALFDLQRNLPKDLGRFFKQFVGNLAMAVRRFQPPDRHAKLQISRLRGEHIVRLEADRAQHGRDPGRVVAVPQ